MQSLSFLLCGSIMDPHGTRRSDRASRGERAVWTASCRLAASDTDTLMLDIGRPQARPIKFRFNKTQLGLKRALQKQSRGVWYPRTTELTRRGRTSQALTIASAGRVAAAFGCTAMARRIPRRYRHLIPCSSIIRPLFGQDCKERWRLVEPTDSRPSPSDDIGRKGAIRQ